MLEQHSKSFKIWLAILRIIYIYITLMVSPWLWNWALRTQKIPLAVVWLFTLSTYAKIRTQNNSFSCGHCLNYLLTQKSGHKNSSFSSGHCFNMHLPKKNLPLVLGNVILCTYAKKDTNNLPSVLASFQITQNV